MENIVRYLEMKVPAEWDKMSKPERIAYRKRYDDGLAGGNCDITKTTTAQLWNEALSEQGKPSPEDSRRIGNIVSVLIGWKKVTGVTIVGYPRSRGFSRH